MIKAILFDVDGVLIDSFDANLKWYQDLMIRAGYIPPTKKAYMKLFHMTLIDVIKSLTKSHDETELKRIWLMGKNREVAYPSDLITFPEKMQSVIQTLRKKYILGIVTSRVKGWVFMSPQLAKLEKYFKITVYYEDTIKHKPDPEPLLFAVNQLKIKPSEAVYIGDAESDIKAAKASGIKIIIYSKESLKGADAQTSRFNTLPKLIEFLP